MDTGKALKDRSRYAKNWRILLSQTFAIHKIWILSQKPWISHMWCIIIIYYHIATKQPSLTFSQFCYTSFCTDNLPQNMLRYAKNEGVIILQTWDAG